MAQPKERERQYWDANIFIAWLSRNPGNLSGEDLIAIRALVRRAISSQVIVVTSDIIHKEVLEAHMKDGHYDVFAKFLKRRNVQVVNEHIRIKKLAVDLRNEYVRNKWSVLSASDATHLATAINSNVDVLYTLDNKHLIKRSGAILGYDIRMEKPPIPPKEAKQVEMGFPDGK